MTEFEDFPISLLNFLPELVKYQQENLPASYQI